jgi:hypothetical protein
VLKEINNWSFDFCIQLSNVDTTLAVLLSVIREEVPEYELQFWLVKHVTVTDGTV